jgi:hypothetical protein
MSSPAGDLISSKKGVCRLPEEAIQTFANGGLTQVDAPDREWWPGFSLKSTALPAIPGG